MQLISQANEDGQKQSIRLRAHKLSLTCICLDSKDEHAFSGSKDGSVIKWCLRSRKILAKINSISKEDYDSSKKARDKHHIKHINSIAISSDDKFLATGGWDKNIRIWSPDNLTWIHTFSMHRQEVTALAFRIGQPTLYSGSADRSVMLWNLEDDDNLCFVEALYGHESTITSMDASRKERVLSSGGRDQSLRIWKIVEQAQTVYATKHESVDIVRYIDDKTFVSGGEDGSISIWSTMKRAAVLSQPNVHRDKTGGQTCWITALAAHLVLTKRQAPKKATKKDDDDLDGAESGGEDSEESSDDEDKTEMELEADAGDNVMALIASGSNNSQVLIWKLIRKGSKHELIHHQAVECKGFINDLKFSKDGTKLVAAVGQEHRFGRWWKIKEARNCMRIIDVNK